jgi:plastocyanin
MRRQLLPLVVAIALSVGFAPSALAGNWATVRLDEPPGEVVAGTPWRVGFSVLQHDVRPTNDVTPRLKARHRETGEAVETVGRQEGDAGHFVAEVTFPRAGEWKWSITPDPFPTSTSFATLAVTSEPERVDASLPGGAGDRTTGRIHPLPPDEGTPTGSAVAEVVEIVDSAFQPAVLHVPVGANVAWHNTGVLAHEVAGDDLAFADSGLLEPGERFEQVFDRPGTYVFRCGPHAGMEGTIVVE